jgi:hypothetical protein
MQVENLIVIFAGSSHRYTNDPNNSMEATAYSLDFAGLGGPFTSSGGYSFNNYTFCPDQFGNLTGQIALTGVCAHEHGHALGMPDLYDYSYTTSGNGYFDIMAFGTFGAANGERPYHFGAFSKAFFGWSNPQVLPPGFHTVELDSAELHDDTLRLYPDGNTNSSEQFLLENRQPVGFDSEFAARGLCPGLLIWHIDETITNSAAFFHVNSRPPYPNARPHPGVTIVEADGGYDMINPPLNYGDCGDTWKVGQTWDATSTPNSSLWNGTASNLSVSVVSENNGTLTLLIKVGLIDLPFKTYLPLTVGE